MPTTATTPRTSPRRLWPAAVLAVLALVGAVASGVLIHQDLQDRLEALPRTAVPGEVTVDVPGPQGMTVFYEDPEAEAGFVVRSSRGTTISRSPVEVAVTGPTGPLTVAAYERDLRFDVDGRVATALATFDAPEAGSYTLQVDGEVPAGALVSVGDVIDARLLVGFAGAVALFVASLLAGAAIAVIAFVRRVDSPTPVATSPRADFDRR